MVLAFWIICKAVQYYLYKLTYTTHRGQSPSDLCLPSWVFMLLEKGICSPGMCMLIQTGLLLTASDPRCRLDLWVQPSAPPRPTRSPDPCGITHTGHKLSFSHRSKLSHLSLSVCLSLFLSLCIPQRLGPSWSWWRLHSFLSRPVAWWLGRGGAWLRVGLGPLVERGFRRCGRVPCSGMVPTGPQSTGSGP